MSSIDLNEDRWHDYVTECDELGLQTSISDYLIWLEENTDEPEPWD